MSGVRRRRSSTARGCCGPRRGRRSPRRGWPGRRARRTAASNASKPVDGVVVGERDGPQPDRRGESRPAASGASVPSEHVEWQCRSITPVRRERTDGVVDVAEPERSARDGPLCETGRVMRGRRLCATRTAGDAVKEACGVVAVSAPGREVSHLVFDALYALQHRGQESAGMASANHETVTVVKDMGLVASVFNERSLAALDGDQVIGHTRYSTQGDVGVARGPARLPRAGRRSASRSRTTATSRTPPSSPSAPGMLPGHAAHRHRRRRRAARRRRWRAGRTLADGDGRGAAAASRARSASCSSRRPASTASATRTASARCASAGSAASTRPRAGRSPRSRPRST